MCVVGRRAVPVTVCASHSDHVRCASHSAHVRVRTELAALRELLPMPCCCCKEGEVCSLDAHQPVCVNAEGRDDGWRLEHNRVADGGSTTGWQRVAAARWWAVLAAAKGDG